MRIIGSRGKGFTLVEIVVVLLIITVMLTMAVVSMSGATAGVALRQSAQNLLTDLRYAHYYAVTHGCQCRNVFSANEKSYELTCCTDPDKEECQPLPGGRITRLDRTVRFSAVAIQQRDSQSDNPQVLTFAPTGESDSARIEITDGHIAYTLSVSPNSGLVRLRKGPMIEIPNDREDLDA
jgi:type II secretion system protein H